MIAQLNENWRITTIPRNWVLQKREVIQESPFASTKTRRAGESKWVDVGYYGSLRMLAESLPDEVALRGDYPEVRDMVFAMWELTAAVKRLEVSA